MKKVRWYLVIMILLLLVITINAIDDDLELKVSEEVLEELEQKDEVEVVITLKDQSEEIQTDEIINDIIIDHEFENAPIVTATVNEEAIEELIDNPNVESVKQDMKVKAFLDTSIPLIHADYAWQRRVNNINITGAGQTICVIDSGVYYNHSNLGGRFGVKILAGKNTITNTNCTIENDQCMDINGHGTHVTGIIISNHTTYKGIAPDVNIVVIPALVDDDGAAGGDASGDMGDVAEGIDWCVSNKDIYNITVITMSLGTTSLYTPGNCPNNYDSSIDSAYQANITMIAASGNDGSTTGMGYPACHSQIIAVGASTDSDTMYSNTNRNSDLEVLAPGNTITSLWVGSTTATAEKSGTSMAAPHVAGVIALLRQDHWEKNHTNLTILKINDYIKTTNVTISGYPRIDVYYSIIPNITFVDPNPANYSQTIFDNIYVNITTSRLVSSAILEINQTNYTMTNNLDKDNFYFNVTGLSGWHNYTVYVNDSSDSLFKSDIMSYELDLNNAPNITLINNISVSVDLTTNATVNITVNATDDEEETLYYGINMSNFTQFNNVFLWNVTYFDTGTYYVNVSVNDSNLSSSQIVKIIVGDLTDSDGDGVYDILDTDDDNDGLVDSSDNLKGDSSSTIGFLSSNGESNSSSVNISVLIDNSTDLVQQFAGEYNITIKVDENISIEAVTNLSEKNINLYNLTISKQNSTYSRGFTIIKGLTLSSGATKTIYIDDVNASFNTICVKDKDINNLSEISSGCSGSNETLVTCDGTNTVYNCSRVYNNTRYRITGLTHSAVHEQCADSDGDGYGTSCPKGSDCNDANAAVYTGCDSSSTSSSGGGGGSSSSASGGGGGIAVEPEEDATKKFTYQKIKKGEKRTVNIDSDVLPITKLSFVVDEAVSSVTLAAKSYKEQPKKVKTNAPGVVYKYMSLEGAGIGEVSDVLINFKVSKSYIKDNDLDLPTLKLYYYDSDAQTWSSEVVKDSGEDFEYYYYTSSFDDFGYLAISLKKNVVVVVEEVEEEPFNESFIIGKVTKQIEEPTDSTASTWAVIVVLIIIAGAFVVIIRSRMNKKDE